MSVRATGHHESVIYGNRRITDTLFLVMKLKNEFSVANPCGLKKDFCVNCHSHFMDIRPFIKTAIVTKRFIKDVRNEDDVNAIVSEILDCSNINYSELHKFEKSVDGYLLFRAKKEGIHVVYCIDKAHRILFLRVCKHFNEYRKFLQDQQEIKKQISHALLQVSN